MRRQASSLHSISLAIRRKKIWLSFLLLKTTLINRKVKCILTISPTKAIWYQDLHAVDLRWLLCLITDAFCPRLDILYTIVYLLDDWGFLLMRVHTIYALSSGLTSSWENPWPGMVSRSHHTGETIPDPTIPHPRSHIPDPTIPRTVRYPWEAETWCLWHFVCPWRLLGGPSPLSNHYPHPAWTYTDRALSPLSGQTRQDVIESSCRTKLIEMKGIECIECDFVTPGPNLVNNVMHEMLLEHQAPSTPLLDNVESLPLKDIISIWNHLSRSSSLDTSV